MSDLAKLEKELNDLILEGKGMEAFEKLYAEDVSMQEHDEPPTKGKDANRKREQEFFANVEQFHGASLLGAAVGDDVTFSEWIYDMTFKGGHRVKLNEVARRRWKNGKVTDERFYYKPAG